MASWMSRQCALGVILVGLDSWEHSPPPHVFSILVDNGSHYGSLGSQSLRNGLVTLSRVIDVSELFHIF